MKELIFFDLDGTLIDPKKRYCAIYKQLCNELKIKALKCDIYWEMKRNKVSEYEIFQKTNPELNDISNILKKRILMLEDDTFLKLDILHHNAVDFLELIYKKYTLVMVTFRRNRPNLESQLKRLGIIQYFDKILSLAPSLEIKYMNKVNIILDNYNILEGFYFGDTEVDLLAGRYLKIKTVSFNFGIRHEKYLNKCEPNFSIDSWDYNIWGKELFNSFNK
jgi:phosphoglycolate phosphatase-like HAD superfamily hydrolase